MKKIIYICIAMLLVAINAKSADFTDVSVSVSGMTTTMTNGRVTIKIDSNGRITSLKYNTHEMLASNGVYFD